MEAAASVVGRDGTSLRSLRRACAAVPKATAPQVLADPWLVGPLTFGPPELAFLYSATKPSGDSLGVAAASGADVLLLAQGLDDHAHRPTLRALAAANAALPVVASPAAAAVARDCGFTNVTAVAPGGVATLRGVTFAATQGALVGPPWSTRECGFLISDQGATSSSADPGVCVYYEPHLDYVESSVRDALRAAGRAVDLVIAPCTAVALAGYPLVLGSPDAVLRLLRLLRPRVLVPLRNDVIAQSGAIAPAIGESGGVEAVRAALAADAQLSACVRLLEAAPAGQPLAIEL